MQNSIYKTTYLVKKMDCHAEEQLIRTKLEDVPGILSVMVDLPQRKVEVFHRGDVELISTGIYSLNLDSHLISSEPIEYTDIYSDDKKQKNTLWQVLIINFFFFVLEFITGIFASSMGLIADSLDMLADSIVYGLSLFAVGGTTKKKKTVAAIAGYFQFSLAIMGFIEVVRRFLGYGDNPDFKIMIIISVLAMMGNIICLYILEKSKSTEAHMKASMIFTSNDIIANAGVILAGIFVYFTASRIPDLVVGTIVFLIVVIGAYRIVKLSL
ncbi:MAG: cation transporter [Syntrophorhabdaceae bacterium]|nr:cation transporter [Syntrophorhabdaceae bacterium]